MMCPVVFTPVNPMTPSPAYQTAGAAGFDLSADLPEPITLKPGHRVLLKTGLHIALPDGYELQIRPRSGLALRKGITVLNTPGTIDGDYRDEIGVILINHDLTEDFVIAPGDRIAQGVICPVVQVAFQFLPTRDDLPAAQSARKGGFGSTGV